MRVSARLHALILDGSLPLGSRLREIPLAKSFDVARGTIRKALFDLMHQGLVIQRPYTGWSVISMTQRDAWELITLLGVLKSFSVRIAAECIAGEKDSRELERIFARLRKAPDKDVAASAAREMSLTSEIVAFTGHERLARHFAIINDQFKVYAIYRSQKDSVDATLPAHIDALCQAILAGDAVRAEQLVEERTRQELKRLQSTGEADAAPTGDDSDKAASVSCEAIGEQ